MHKTTAPKRRIKKLRQKLGLSQGDVANKIGCTRSHYANMENGYRNLNPPYGDRLVKLLRRA